MALRSFERLGVARSLDVTISSGRRSRRKPTARPCRQSQGWGIRRLGRRRRNQRRDRLQTEPLEHRRLLAADITNVSSVTPDGQYVAGEAIEIGVTFSAPVSVVGTPQLRLSSGSSAFARFDPAATGTLPATTLKFTYRVQSAENAADLDYATVTSLELGDSTSSIVDTFGVPAQLTLPVPGAMKSLGWNKNLVVDTAPPTASITLSKNAVGNENNSATVWITLSEPSSDFTLSDLVATSNGTALSGVLRDFVGSGRSYSALFTPPADFTGTVLFTIAAGAFTDPAGNANVVLPDSGAQLYVDTKAPVVRQVTSSTRNDVYKAVGDTVDIQIEFSTPVAVGGLGPEGFPFLELNSGSGARAEYVSAMGSVVTFRYTVAANEQSLDLDYRSISSLKGGYILRLDTGTQALRTLPEPGGVGSLAWNKSLTIDTRGPGISITSTRYVLSAGQKATITFALDEAAAPWTSFDLADVTIFNSAAGTFDATTWRYDPASLKYTVDFTPALNYSGQVGFFVDANSFADAASNGNAQAALSQLITINTASPQQPTIESLISNTGSPVLRGTTGTSTLQPNQRLLVEVNGKVYDSRSGSAGVRLSGNVWSLDLATAVPVFGTWAPLADGTYDVVATIIDEVGNENRDASIDELMVDTVDPRVVAVTSPSLDSPPAYGIGKVISIDIEFTEDVTVTGTPALQLNAGAGARALYVSQPKPNVLRFEYTVGSGDSTTDLDYASASALTLNGGTIRDAAKNNAALALTTPGSAGSLAAAKNIAIETAVPTVTIASSKTSLRSGETAMITLTFTEDVVLVTGRTVTLGNATVASVAPTFINPRTYTLTFVPAANVQGGLGTVLVAAGVFEDAAGNPNAAAALETAIAIDTAPPSTPSVAPLSTKLDLPTLVGTINPALGEGETLDVLVNGSSFAVVPVGTTWSLPLATATPVGGGTFAALPNGTYVVIATTRDLAGNMVESTPINLVIDSVAPAAPLILTVTDDSSPVLGPVVSNGVTNDTSLLLTGTAEPGATVHIYNGSVLLGTATGSATWTYTASGLQDGVTYSFTARATDAAGNESLPSAAYTVTVDTSAPAAPAIVSAADDELPQMGIIPNGGSTNDRTVTLTGTTEPGSAVSVFRNGDATPLGNAVVTGSNWTFTTPSLPDGSYVFTARATDAAGNLSVASAGYTVTVDMTAPAAPVIVALADDVPTLVGGISTGDTTDDTQPTLSGTAAAGTVAVTIYDRASNTLLGAASLIGTNWTFTTPPLTNGVTYLLAAIGEDAAGNASGFSNSFSVTIDTAAPGAPVITSVIDDAVPLTGSLANGVVTNDDILVLNGLTEAGTTVSVYSGTTLLGTVSPSGTSWAFTTARLTGGVTYSFTARATDAAGNESLPSAAYTLTVDTSAPAAPTITAVTDDQLPSTDLLDDGAITNDSQLILTGRTDALTSVDVYANEVWLGSATVNGMFWSFTTPLLTDGTYEFIAIAMDAAGNISPTSLPWTVTVDTESPAVLSVFSETPAGSYNAGTPIILRVRFSEPVIVTGIPSIVLNTPTARGAVYFEGSGTEELQFLYVVQPGDSVLRLDYVSTDALTLNGGSIVDAAFNAASLVLPPPTSLGAFRNTTQAIRIDARAPSVIGITPVSPNGVYGLNQTVRVAVAFSEIVYVLDTPTIDLNTTPQRQAVYSGGSGTRVLTFDYAIQTGDFSSDLNYVASTSLRLSGGVIRDGARNDAVLTLPNPDAPLSLGSQAAIVVDAAIRAIATGLGASPGTAPTFMTAVTTIPITFNTPVTNFRLTDIRLFFENRSVSLTGAQLTGSGASYTLTLRSTTASLKGAYRLVIGGPTSGITSGGVFMTTPSKFYWRRA